MDLTTFKVCGNGEVPKADKTACEACGSGKVPNNDKTACETCGSGKVPNTEKTACQCEDALDLTADCSGEYFFELKRLLSS